MSEKKQVKDITLHIFGKDFFMQTDEDNEYTEQIAKTLSDEMKSIAQKAGSEKYEKIAVIAAMNVIDKYLKLEIQYKEIEKRFNDLIEKLQ